MGGRCGYYFTTIWLIVVWLSVGWAATRPPAGWTWLRPAGDWSLGRFGWLLGNLAWLALVEGLGRWTGLGRKENQRGRRENIGYFAKF